MKETAKEHIRYFAFAALVGVLLLLNWLGVFKTVLGFDTAAIITLLAGYKTFHNAIAALLEKRISADLAICIAVVAALSAGEYLAAAEAMFIILLGEGLESYAAGRTEAAIHRFVEQLPRRARVLREGAELEVDASALAPDDVILVRAGERIAADGVIQAGVSSIDESSITGEPLPKDKQAGEEVFSGSLNGNGLLQVRVTRAGPETTLARVIQLVEEARTRQAPVERRADRYAKFFLPVLLLAAALTFYFTRDWMRTVAVLLVACPCALILATPTAMVAAIGGLARRGILVRGGSILERAAEVDTVVFDKTGTVTEGRFEVLKVLSEDGDQDRVLVSAARAEQGSSHMLARAISEEARRRNLTIAASENARVIPGRGAECHVDSCVIRAGNAAFLAENGIHDTGWLLDEADRLGATAVLVAEDSALLGAVLLRDRIREGIREAVRLLAQSGIQEQSILTGDRRKAAEAIAREIGISRVEAELLPEQKLGRIRELNAQGRVTAMVGDGINDAPALAEASVGIAVNGASDIAVGAADVVYLPHSLERLPLLFEVSGRAMRIAWQNIVFFAGVVNFGAVLLCAWGVLGPIGAAFTHQLSSFFVMLNSLRLLRVGKGRPIRMPDFPKRLRTVAQSVNWRGAGSALWGRRHQLAKPVTMVFAGLWVLSGFYSLAPNEVGVVQRFGKHLVPDREPGIHYKLPWPLEELTRVEARRVRVVEVGFRSNPSRADAEPAAYEWNVQHRAGRFQRRPKESLMLSGDQNLMDVNVTVHFRLARPSDYLLRQVDGENTIRTATESVLQSIVTTSLIDRILTAGREDFENRVREHLQRRLDRYRAGVEVIRVKLQDVHPSLEVVDAFREVSGAFEEKNRLVNEAEGYRNEQIALARGNASARIENASAYSLGRKNRSEGDAARFVQAEQASRTAPEETELRLYLETMEQVLPGKRKLIVDPSRGRRHLLLLEDGVEIAPPAALREGSK